MIYSLICDRVSFYTCGELTYFIYSIIQIIFTSIGIINYISIKIYNKPINNIHLYKITY